MSRWTLSIIIDLGWEVLSFGRAKMDFLGTWRLETNSQLAISGGLTRRQIPNARGKKSSWPNSGRVSSFARFDFKHTFSLVMCFQISRFVSQLVTTPVGISGCGFFIISKSFMVTLISALVTYEVIILQFQGASIPAE